jgi:hypothetical protein
MRDDLFWLRYAFGAVALTLVAIALPTASLSERMKASAT